MDKQLASSLCHLEQLGLQQLSNPIWVYDVTGYGIHWANSAAMRLWEADDLQELCNRNFSEGASDAVQQTLLGYLREFEQGNIIDRWWRISPKGVDKHILCRFSGVLINDGRPAMLVEAQDSHLLSNYASGYAGASIVGLFDTNGHLRSFNPLFSEQFGDTISHFSELFEEEQDWQELFSQCDNGRLEQDMMLITLEGARWHRLELEHQHGQMDSQQDVIATLIDIHDRKLRELRHVQESLSDALTGLLNRRGLQQKLHDIGNAPYSLFYIDLDGFKPINDSYGHAAGDTLLQNIANTLKHDIDDRAVAARLGGDEFILVMPQHISEQYCQRVAQRIVQLLSVPIELPQRDTVAVSASVGVARAPADGASLDNLLACADAAMYLAKKRGRSRWIRYTQGMEEHMRRRTLIVQSLDRAISGNHLTLHYQAITDTASDTTPLVEALLRWQHPKLGMLTPEEVIRTAEETGKIAALENWVIHRACQDLPRIRAQLQQAVRISINISGAHLTQENFFDNLQAAISQHGLQADDVLLELTENILVSIAENQHFPLHKLCDAGYQFAIDDFGTGFSSLAYLSQIPASYVKIDPAFIKNLDRDYHTVQCIQQLCGKLNMQVIAEGVETAEQAESLVLAGIALQQGFYFDLPKALP